MVTKVLRYVAVGTSVCPYATVIGPYLAAVFLLENSYWWRMLTSNFQLLYSVQRHKIICRPLLSGTGSAGGYCGAMIVPFFISGSGCEWLTGFYSVILE